MTQELTGIRYVISTYRAIIPAGTFDCQCCFLGILSVKSVADRTFNSHVTNIYDENLKQHSKEISVVVFEG